ncbi:SMI1/KNR4 family protein [Nannocystis sp. SCPEA4]|uniref:SMI1/KNR4 family protein n=1 Tax=Nannocystis sp. SCPEA4 TaxID=2996787 RepID=UPI00226F92EE|nr:SMI1/KNR4 family protein [Nannocystis sp. SCPEA4]MCY1057913.1 SMI1/KNR4 family protein [Nannocystis sp. SCPEA4]
MSNHAVLATVDEVPVLRAVVEHLIPLADEARRFVFVLCADDVGERVAAALAGLPVVDRDDDEKTTARCDPRTLADLRALCWALATIFEAPEDGPFVTELGYLNLAPRVVAGPDRAAVRAALVKAKLTVADAAELTAGRPAIDDEAAIARAMAPFEEHFAPEVAEAARAWLEGEDGAIPAVIREAESEYYGNPAGVVSDALTGAAERWNARTSRKLLDLWIACREVGAHLSLGLGEDELPPELGVDRARIVATALEAGGLDPALAVLAAKHCQGASTWYLAQTLLARPAIFTDALGLGREVARALAAAAVPVMGPQYSPSALERLRAFVASRSPALGTEALLKIAELLPDAVDEGHFEVAAEGAEPLELCKLARALEEADASRFAGMLRRANERWMSAAEPAAMVEQLREVQQRDEALVDAEVAWSRLLERLANNPGDPFGDGPEGGAIMKCYFVVEALRAPTGALKERLGALCREHGSALGSLRRPLEKKAGIKPPPAPYVDADLKSLPEALAKAWKTARKKSWAAGVRLPAGAKEAALVAAEKVLGSKLPAELRASFTVHDGAGEDECFRGGRLYAIAEAVKQRAWLLEVDGAPFDADWLPITDDGAGNHACVVFRGKDAGVVMDFDHETGCGRRLAKSFAAFLQGANWE